MAESQQLDPNFLSQNKGTSILAICSTLTAIASSFVAARLYVRAKLLSRVGLDDWLIILSMGFVYITFGLNVASVKAGNGQHMAALSLKQKSDAILFTIAGFCPGILSFAIPKLAVVALLTKIMNPSRKHKIFLWALTSGCLLILLGCVVILFAQCNPSRSQWDFSVEKKCWSPWILVYYSMFAGNVSAAVDLYLAVYPAVVLYRLQLNMRKKLALSFALGLGSVAAAVAVYKSTRLPGLASADFTYNTSDITIWTSIEGNAIVIAACIPTLQPLFDLILGRRVFGSTNDRRYYKGYKESGRVKTGSGAIELSASANTGNKSVSKHRKMGISDVTVAKDSQESILGVDDSQSHQSHQSQSQGQGQGQGRSGTAWIQRTDDVIITYGEPMADGPKVGERRGV